MCNKFDYINVSNYKIICSRIKQNRDFSEYKHNPILGILDQNGAIGIMIAGNFARPGGACMQIIDSQSKLCKFKSCPHAKTQEESVLSCIYEIHKDNEIIMLKQLQHFTSIFGMSMPKGDKNDFYAIDSAGQNFDIQKSDDVKKYSREFSFWAKSPNSQNKKNGILLSFVNGPNASSSCDNSNWPDPRKPVIDKETKQIKLDSVYRTRSLYAIVDYNIFREMLMTAMISSLCDMARKNLRRVVIAPLSCGLYAGPWFQTVRKHFHSICIQCLEIAFQVIKKEQNVVHCQQKYLFKTVWIPIYE